MINRAEYLAELDTHNGIKQLNVLEWLLGS